MILVGWGQCASLSACVATIEQKNDALMQNVCALQRQQRDLENSLALGSPARRQGLRLCKYQAGKARRLQRKESSIARPNTPHYPHPL